MILREKNKLILQMARRVFATMIKNNSGLRKEKKELVEKRRKKWNIY